MRVLVVDDEVSLARIIQIGLRREGMAVDLAHDGRAALNLLAAHDYDTVVLDRDLPEIRGDEVCEYIVEQRLGCAVLMLTAAGRTADKVAGLTMGADDYLAKPFDFPELVARLHALHRRPPLAHTPELRFADLLLDVQGHRATRGGAPMQLAPKELAVLELLMRAGGKVLSLDDLAEGAWDTVGHVGANAVRLVVHSLRRKLGDPPLLHTAVGAGYYLGPQ